MVKEFSFNGNRIRVEDGWIYAADISSIMTGYQTNVAHLTARLSSEDMRRGYRNAVLINESGFYNMTAGRKYGAELRKFAEENIFMNSIQEETEVTIYANENVPQIFNNDEFGNVRILKEDGELLFCATDVAAALGYAKPRNAIEAHCKGALKRGVLTSGGVQSLVFIPEPDLYRLIFSSKLPSAERFEQWVVGTILPSIRKTGSYNVTSNTDDDILRQAFDILQRRSIEWRAKYEVVLAERNELQLQLDNVKKALGFTTNSLSAISSEDPIDYIHRNRKILHNFLNACVRSYTQKRHGTNNFGLGWSDFYTRLQKNIGEDIRLRGEPYIDHITDEEMTAAINVANAMKSPKLQIEDATMTVVQKVLAA